MGRRRGVRRRLIECDNQDLDSKKIIIIERLWGPLVMSKYSMVPYKQFIRWINSSTLYLVLRALISCSTL